MSLTDVSMEIERALRISHEILPMCDEKVSTHVETIEHGVIPFQEYFVERKCKPVVRGFHFHGINSAAPTRNVIETLERAEAIVICPSNPFVSIDPIISLKGIKEKLKQKYVIAVSPLIKGKAIKGPLTKMLEELEYKVGPSSIAKKYMDFLNCLYIDSDDFSKELRDELSGIIIEKTDIFLPDIESRIRLAKKIISHLGDKKP
jgi:LPPG:FO 2-phospho-L-lactate transferase